MCLNIVKNWSINGNLHKTFIVIVSKTEFSQSVRESFDCTNRTGVSCPKKDCSFW